MQNEAGRTELDILKHVQNTFENKGWTKGVAARNAQGIPVNYFDDDATCFCLIGALHYAVFDLCGYTVVGDIHSFKFNEDDSLLVSNTGEMLLKQMKATVDDNFKYRGLVWFNDEHSHDVSRVQKLVHDTIEYNS